VGVFAYSKEEGTPAWHMKDQVSEEIKLERRGELMLAQQAVSLAKNEAKLGSVYDVLVEGKIEDYYTGRSYEMAPEIDGEILIETNKELIAGNWIKVKITEALEYDLIGEVYHESSK
jgi:ribosomal protein S12 methylthiotransferase